MMRSHVPIRAAVIGAAVFWAGHACAAQIVQNFTFNGASVKDSYTSYYDVYSSPIDLFDGSLGTLTSYSFSFSGTARYDGAGQDSTSYVFTTRYLAQGVGTSSGSINGPGSFAFSGSGAQSGFQTYPFSGTGTISLSVAFAQPTTATAGSGSITYIYTPSPTAAVLEPAAWIMMIAGFGAIGGVMRRRKVTVGFA